MLKAIVDQNGKFRFVAPVQLTQTPHSYNLRCFCLSTVLAHQHHLAVIVGETNTAQAFMSSTLTSLQWLKIAHVNTAFGKFLMELNHEGLILWADGDLLSILHRP